MWFGKDLILQRWHGKIVQKFGSDSAADCNLTHLILIWCTSLPPTSFQWGGIVYWPQNLHIQVIECLEDIVMKYKWNTHQIICDKLKRVSIGYARTNFLSGIRNFLWKYERKCEWWCFWLGASVTPTVAHDSDLSQHRCDKLTPSTQ